MKNITQTEKPRRLTKLLAALGLAALAAPMAFGASATWTNAPTDATWTNVLNWIGQTVPGQVNNTANNGIDTTVATFTNAIATYGGAAHPIIPDDGTVVGGANGGAKARMVGAIVFDTASCGPYVFYSSSPYYSGATGGNPETGVLSLCVNAAVNNGSTNESSITGPVTQPQNFLIPVQIRLPSSDNGVYYFSNGATATAATFYFNNLFLYPGATSRGVLFDFTGPNTGTNTVALLSCNASTAAANGIRKEGTGKWILAGSDTIPAAGSVSIQGGTLEVQNSGAFGAVTTPAVTNATLQIDGVTLNQNFLNLYNGGTIRMNGSGAINSITVGNQPATSVTVATTSATDVFTIGTGGNTFKGGAADTIIHLAGPGTNLLNAPANTITNGTWSIDGGVAQVGSGGALGLIPATITFGSGSTGTLMLNSQSYTALAVTSSPTAGSPVILNGGGSSTVLTVSNGVANTFAGSLQDGTGGGNLGLTKVALGTLTLSGSSTYTGNTIINNGTLSVSGTLGNTAVAVNSGGTLAGSGSISGSVSLSSGGIILPGGNASVGTITVGSLALNSGGGASFDFNGTTNDLVVVSTSGGLTVNGGSVNLYQSDGLTPFAANGTYNLIQYSGSISGSAGNLTVGNPQAGFAYAFGTAGGYITLTITTSGINTAWNVDANGNWSTGSNWRGGTAPHAAGDSATLGVGSALRTVTLDTAESVGGLTFTNNNSFVVASAGNTLTLDNKGAGAPVTVQNGTANAIQTAVSFNDNVTASVSSGKTLNVSGNISATANQTLAVSGAGTLALSGNNSYGPSSSGSFGTTLSGGGTLSVGNSSALGVGDVNVTGNSTLLAGAAGLNLTNNVTVESLINATVDTSGNTLTLSGAISGSSSITKNGAGTLVLAGNSTYTGTYVINSGVVSISQSGNVGQDPGSESPNFFLNGGDLLGTASFTVDSSRDIAIGPVSGSVGTNGLIDAAPGITFGSYGAIYSAGNSGIDGLSINTGSGNTGTVYLAGAGSFTGPTYIAQGALQVANSLTLQASTLDYTNGTLLFDSGITAATIAEIAGTQNLVLTNLNNQGVTLTLGGDNGSATYTAGFTDGGLGGAVSKTGSGTLTLAGTNNLSGSINVGIGEVLIPTNGVSIVGSVGVTGTPNTPELLLNGGSLTATNATIAASGSGGAGNFVISSGTASFSGTVLLDAGSSENSVNCAITVNTNGAFYASSLTVGRGGQGSQVGQPAAGYASQGLIVNGGTAVVTNALFLGPAGANSGTSSSVDSGTLTVGGVLTVGANCGNSRWAVFDVDGGSLTVGDTVYGTLLGSGQADEGNAILLVRAGTASTPVITLGNTNYLGTTPVTNVINLTGGALYVGSGGIVQPATNNTAFITLNGGILGASAAWSTTNGITLGGSAIQAADSTGAAHNITLTGPIGGATNLIKTGAGTLTLTAGNFYTGGATLNAGTLNINGSYTLGGALYGGLTFNGGTLQFATGFSGNGPGDFSQNTAATPAAVPVTFTANAIIDVQGNTVVCTNGIGNGGNGGLVMEDTYGPQSGVLELQGANNYNGPTTVNSGILQLDQPSIKSTTTVSIAGSPGELLLNFTGNNVVSNLVLGGVSQPPGTYNFANHPAYFAAGNGSLVVPATGPGTFTAVPGITHFALAGANVVLNGINGQAGDAYYLLSGTNLAQPLTQWKTVATNVFGSAGAFTFTGTNAVITGSAQQFYILSNTNYNH